MNFANNMMGMVAPLATGYIVSGTRSFTYAFLAAGATLLVGITAFVFVLGQLEPISIPAPWRRTRPRSQTRPACQGG